MPVETRFDTQNDQNRPPNFLGINDLQKQCLTRPEKRVKESPYVNRQRPKWVLKTETKARLEICSEVTPIQKNRKKMAKSRTVGIYGAKKQVGC